jgi:hypothetical protein
LDVGRRGSLFPLIHFGAGLSSACATNGISNGLVAKACSSARRLGVNARGPFDAVIADSCGDVVPSGRLCVNKPSAVQHKLSSVVQTAIAPKGEAPVADQV